MESPIHKSTPPHPLGQHTQRTPRLLLRPLSFADAPSHHETRRHYSTMQWTSKRPEVCISETHARLEDEILRAPESMWKFCVELLVEDERLTEDLRSALMGWEGAVIGTLGATGGPEFGYLLHPAFQGRGYGSEAVRGFLEMFWRVVPAAPISSTGEQTIMLEASEARRTQEGPAALPFASSNGTAIPAQMGMSTYEQKRANPPKLKDGWNYIEACTDAENWQSIRLLQRLGFTLWASIKDDFNSVNMGLRSTKVFRLPRPGTVLGDAPGPFQLG